MIKNPPASAVDIGDVGLISGSGRSLGGGKWQPTPVFLPIKSHGQRSLVGRKELNMPERLSEHIHTRSHKIALPMPPTPVALQEQASADRCPILSFHHILKVGSC